MAVCAGITRDGKRCTQYVRPGLEYCHRHDPSRSEERKRAASRASRSKPSREIKDLKRQLANLAEDLLEHRVGSGVAAIVNQIINTRARLIELERKIREEEELLARIEQLEQSQETNSSGGRQWAR